MAVELQFLQTLTTEAQHAYQIAQYLMNNPGVTIGRASWTVTGKSWTAARLTSGLGQVSSALAQVGGAGGDFAVVEQVIAHGTTAAAEAGGGAAAGGVISRVVGGLGRGILRIFGRQAAAGSAAALGVGAVATIAAVAGVAYLGSEMMGRAAADSSVQAGAQAQQPRAAAVTVQSRGRSDGYGVFLLPNNSGGTLWVGRESDLRGLRGCDTPNGGTCDAGTQYPPVTYRLVSPTFTSQEDALASLCANTVQRSGPWGNRAEGYGGAYWSEYSCG